MWLVLGPIGLVDVEEVGMLAKTLALLVALTLKRLPMAFVDAQQSCNSRVDVDDQRVVGVEIATVAGPDVLPLVLVVERGGEAALIDLRAHWRAGIRV